MPSILEVLLMLTNVIIYMMKENSKVTIWTKEGEPRWDWNVISLTVITMSSSSCSSYHHWLPDVFGKYVTWPFGKFFWNLPFPKHTIYGERHLLLKSLKGIKDKNTQAKRKWSVFLYCKKSLLIIMIRFLKFILIFSKKSF